MSLTKKVYILIGQKGSGKSLAGQIIEDQFGVKFVRVEDVVINVKKNRAVNDESYHKDAFTEIESRLRKVLKDEPSVVFESTGLGNHFNNMFRSLKNDYQVITIGIKADPDLCRKRIKSRDQSSHINVSDEDVLLINSLVRRMNFLSDYEIDNNGSIEDLTSSLKGIFTRLN